MKVKILSLIKKILKQELVKGSMYIFIGSTFSNIFNFLFNLFMSRNLKVEDYGTLTSLVSIIALVITPVGAIIPTIVNFAGERFAIKDYGEVRMFFLKIVKPLVFIGLVLLFCFIFFNKSISNFFHIKDQSLIIICGLIVFLAYIGIINSGLLQAKLSFKFISFSNFIGTFIKLTASVPLVLLGFKLKAVMWVMFISGFVTFAISFIPLRFLFKGHELSANKMRFKNLLSYGIPSSLATLGLTSLISTDILLVKHFYDPLQAGIYAGLSLVGRVIFFISAPIGSVMFPLVVQKYKRRKNYNNVFKMAIILVFIPSVIISIAYFLFPDFTIGFFIKNKAYLSAADNLGLFGVFITLYSLISLFVYYFLSIKKTNAYIPVVFSAIVQALLITLYHDSLFEVVIISLVVSAGLLISLLFYYIKTVANRNVA